MSNERVPLTRQEIDVILTALNAVCDREAARGRLGYAMFVFRLIDKFESDDVREFVVEGEPR